MKKRFVIIFAFASGLLSAQNDNLFNKSIYGTSIFNNSIYADPTVNDSDRTTQTPKQSIRIYENVNGIQSSVPSKIIESNGMLGGYDVYEVTDGLQNSTPSQTIIPNPNGGYDMYNVLNGIPSIVPAYHIEK